MLFKILGSSSYCIRNQNIKKAIFYCTLIFSFRSNMFTTVILFLSFFTANRVEHILPETHFRLSCKPCSQLVSNPVRWYHHRSNSKVNPRPFSSFDNWTDLFMMENEICWGDLLNVLTTLFFFLFLLQAVLRVPYRHAVQKSWDPVLGVWVSKTDYRDLQPMQPTRSHYTFYLPLQCTVYPLYDR